MSLGVVHRTWGKLSCAVCSTQVWHEGSFTSPKTRPTKTATLKDLDSDLKNWGKDLCSIENPSHTKKTRRKGGSTQRNRPRKTTIILTYIDLLCSHEVILYYHTITVSSNLQTISISLNWVIHFKIPEVLWSTQAGCSTSHGQLG